MLRKILNRLRTFSARASSVGARIRKRGQEHAVKSYVARLRRKSPRILIAPNFLQLGGIKEHIESIAEYSALGAELIPAPSIARRLKLDGIPKIFSNQFMNLALNGTEAVHTHVFPWAIRWGRRMQAAGIRWVHTYHPLYCDDYAIGPMPDWQIEFNRSQLNEACHADVRVSVSQWQKAYLEAEHAITTLYVPNGVDVAACDRAVPARFKKAYATSSPFILYLGRDDPVKNPAEFALLAARMPELSFVMAGRNLTSSYLYKHWQTISPSNLSFLPMLSHSSAMDAIAACDALVVTSKREGLPTLILEAMACRKPIVAPREAGCMEALDGGAYGHLYEPGNVPDLECSLRNALEDSLRPRLARKRVEEHYDWRIVAGQLDALYAGSKTV